MKYILKYKHKASYLLQLQRKIFHRLYFGSEGTNILYSGNPAKAHFLQKNTKQMHVHVELSTCLWEVIGMRSWPDSGAPNLNQVNPLAIYGLNNKWVYSNSYFPVMCKALVST